MTYLDTIAYLRENTDKLAARECWVDMHIRYRNEQQFYICKTFRVDDKLVHTVLPYIPSHSDVTHDDWKIIP